MLKKTYISEKKAIDILTEATGRKITAEHMKIFSDNGIVPAYMKFKPKDKDLYDGDSFHLVNEIVAANAELGKLAFLDALTQEEFRVLPFPLPKNGMIKTIEGIVHKGVRTEDIEGQSFRVYVARNDDILEEVSEEHYVKVYAPNEVQQAKENVVSYLDGNGYRPMKHSCCEEWDAGEIDVSTRGYFASPFAEEIDSLNFKKRIRKNQSGENTAKSKKSELIVISAMLKIIENLITQQAGREYKQNKITNLITGKIFPGVIESRTVNGLFADANKMPEELAIKAREKFDALANFPMATKPEQKK